MGLKRYHQKRDFERTPEPRGSVGRRSKKLAYVIQEHAASRLHYDFRLEHRGVLLSWAVPKGPSLDPADKRLAVHVEDHPLDYGGFEGVIPAGQYGGGRVMLWDRGHWKPTKDVDAGMREGKLEFELEGRKLGGAWALVRLGGRRASDSKNWLLFKRNDRFARTGAQARITELEPQSVKSGRSLADFADTDGRPRKNGRAGGAVKKTASKTTRTPRTRTTRTRKTGSSPARARKRAATVEPRGVEGAARRALPSFVAPQLATLVDEVPTGDGWVFETKFDGYRMLARVDRGRVRWISRNRKDWSEHFDELTPAVAALKVEDAIFDGEVVVLRPDGSTSFQDLQSAFGGDRRVRLSYVVFDLLHLNGHDLRGVPLVERKRLLRDLLAHVQPSNPVQFSEHVEGSGAAVFRAACRAHLEGVIAKRADAPHRETRTREWLKIKCGQRQEFVIVGFTEPQGRRVGFGALALAVHDHGALRYAGRVGTGFDFALLESLRARLDRLRVDEPPVRGPLSADARRGVKWVEPKLVAEVGFTAWTADGQLRHPTFEGLREDKSPREVVRERSRRVAKSARDSARSASKPRKARASPAAATREKREAVAGVVITHPTRVLFSETGTTKLDLAQFYEQVAPLLLPHIVDRPLSIVRCPSGTSGACFFQKHAGPGFPAAVGSVEVPEASGKARYLSIDSLEALISLVQMGALELHPWGSRNDRLEAPDRATFDLDPAPGVAWPRVVEAALQLRARLRDLGLESFVKTTGGKGLHVVVPLERRATWDELKSFTRSIAEDMARDEPARYLSTASKAQREGRIFVDYLRNGRGATAVSAYSVRARPAATVATPIAWDELGGKLRGDSFTVDNLARRLASKKRDPWADFFSTRQALPKRSRPKSRA
jgi:bifunctional non-homologous end joining protein LigD